MDGAAASKERLCRLPPHLERLQKGTFSRHQGCITTVRSCGPVLQDCTGGFNNGPWVVWHEKAWESSYPVIPGDLWLLHLAAPVFPTTPPCYCTCSHSLPLCQTPHRLAHRHIPHAQTVMFCNFDSQNTIILYQSLRLLKLSCKTI